MEATFKPNHGAITLFIDGQPQLCVTYKSTERADDQLFAETVQKTVRDVAAFGLHIHLVPIFFDWPANGDFDFSRMDWRVEQVLRADPQAWIIIRIQAISMAPKWWMDANPDGVIRFGFSRGVETPKAPFQTLPAPSLGSNFWEQAGIPALVRLAKHVRSRPYSSRVIGYLPTAYNTNEWYFRGYDSLQVNDLCPAMQQRFGKWLNENYGLPVDTRLPDRLDRHLADRGYLFDPDPRRSKAPVTAFYQFYSQLCAETIVKVCQALRQVHLPDRIIVGTFYGYAIELAQFHWLADSGHLDYERLLQEDGPDFTCNPLSYFSRNPHDLPAGGWIWSLSSGVDSARVHGKAYFGEDDFLPPDEKGLSAWAGASNLQEDIETLRRNFAFTLCKGQNQWWYDLHGHYYDQPERLDVIEQCTRIAYEAINRKRGSVSEVAVVIDEKAPMVCQLDLEFQKAMFWQNFYHSFARIGAPVDLFMLSDLSTADLSQYKAIFFPTCFSMTDQDRWNIEKLKSDNRTLVFYQADGFIHPNSATPFDVERITSLTGINIRTSEGLWHSILRLSTLDEHPLTVGFADRSFGPRLEKALNFYVDDPQAEVLACFNGRGAAGMTRKSFPAWNSIYCAVPVIDAALVHNIIKEAGVHIYTSDRFDIVYACQSYVALFTRHTGERTLYLPYPSRLVERFHNTADTDMPVEGIVFQAQAYTTYLFEYKK